MKIVKPSYQILQCPDGEEALALIERIGRIAYKSEDKIDDGKRPCSACGGGGRAESSEYVHPCVPCDGTGVMQTEPSSHKFVRMLLKSNRREQLKKKAIDVWANDGLSLEGALGRIVDMTLDYVRDNPPHESVIEHVSITVLFTTARSITHELVRHRICAFTQSSTRYINWSLGKFGSEIPVIERSEQQLNGMLGTWMEAVAKAEEAYMTLTNNGVKAEIARDLLPQIAQADLCVTANLREWAHIFRLRCSPAAHPDMRALMLSLRDELRRRIPIIFDKR